MTAAVLSLILFLSGASALIFQTLWLRLGGLAFGNSVWSAAIVLSSFMAGLALGNGLAARGRWRPRRPLRTYAGLELAVGFFGCTVVFLLPVLGGTLRPVFQTLWPHDSLINIVRLIVSFLILLVPTTGMGLTLPVLLDDAVLRRFDLRRATGLLYGANTLGAVLGVIAGERWLVAAVGLWGAGMVAAAASATAAGLAWLVAPGGAIQPATERTSPRRAVATRLLFVCFGTGAIFLGLEVVWFRFLGLYVASSTTAFSVMLAVLLSGIGLGGLTAGVVRRVVSVPLLLLLAALATMLCYAFFPVPTPAAQSGWLYLESPRQVAWLAAALGFPVAFASGVLFPALVAAMGEGAADRMQAAGLATLFNTVGAALGPLLTGFVLLPALGFQNTLLVGAAGYAMLALVAGGRAMWSWREGACVGPATVTMGVIACFIFFPWHRDEVHFGNARRAFEADGSRLMKRIEGTSDTLQLLRCDVFGQPYHHRLVTNGFSMSGTHPRSQRYMRLFAQLPLALRPGSKEALLICYGVGVTADAFTHDALLERLDIVDVSREVFGLAGESAATLGSNPLSDRRVHSFVQDGRFFLQANARRYDIITGEPPPLKVAGAVNLYTGEFFSLMRERLKPDGIATFWLPIYQLQVDEVKAVLAAFHQAFPNTSVWSGPDQEWIMLGMNGPGRALTEAELRRLWTDPGMAADLVRHGLEVPEQLGALFLMDADEVGRITTGFAPLTDQFPQRLTGAAPNADAIHKFAWTYLEGPVAYRRFQESALMRTIWPKPMTAALEPYFAIREFRYLATVTSSNWLAALDLYLRDTRLRTPVLEVLNTDEYRVAIAEKVRATANPPREDIRSDLIAGALARRDFPTAIRLLEGDKMGGPANSNDVILLTYLYCLTNQVAQAERFAAGVAPSLPRDSFLTWFWDKLRVDFGFRPPR